MGIACMNAIPDKEIEFRWIHIKSRISLSGQRAILLLCVFQMLNSYFSTDSYVVTIRWNRLDETIPTNGHNIRLG